MKRVLAMAALIGLACGGEADNNASVPEAEAAETPVATAAAVPQSEGAVHTVDMVLNDQAEYRFVPSALTIKSGDTVRWVNVSGGPHNVKFYPDSIPAGAAEVLTAAMEGRTLGPLESQLLVTDQQTYEISFAGAPTGTYHYTCTPHQLLGMNGTLTVQ